MLGFDLHSWEQLMLISLGIAGLIAIAVFVTTAAVVILTRHENAETKREYEEYKLTVDAKVADAKKEGIAAGKAAGDALLKAATLEKEAEQLRKDTADANARAAEATRKATESQLALEKYRSPRTLDALQVARVKKAVERFAGTPFDVSVTLESEPQGFGAQIGTLLESAGWVWKNRNNTPGIAINLGPHQAGMVNMSGMGIEIDVSKTAEWQEAVLNLGNALLVEGIQLIMNRATDNSASPDAVHIYVGSKK